MCWWHFLSMLLRVLVQLLSNRLLLIVFDLLSLWLSPAFLHFYWVAVDDAYADVVLNLFNTISDRLPTVVVIVRSQHVLVNEVLVFV